jgi:DNA-binding MarR family transcriptional regulator
MTHVADDMLTDESIAIGQLEDSFGFLIRMTQVQVFEAFFNAVGHHEFKPGEFSVLWIISLNPEVRQGEIAQRLSIKPAHMTKVVQRLEGRGLIERRIPDNDRRSVRLNLTKHGQDFVAQNKKAYFTYYENNGRLSATEMDSLTKLLQKYIGLKKGYS